MLSERELVTISRIDRQLSVEEPQLAEMFVMHAHLVAQGGEGLQQAVVQRSIRGRTSGAAARGAAVLLVVGMAVVSAALALPAVASTMAHALGAVG